MLLLILSGCISEQAVINKYYTIEETGNEGSDVNEQVAMIGGFCEVAPVEINSMYERTQIVNRSASHEITYYKYHQWAIRPSVSIREMVVAQMEDTDLFEGVSTRYMSRIPDYRLLTKVRKLEVFEDEDEDGFSALLDIEFRLLDASGTILLDHGTVSKEELKDKDLNLFAEAVSSIISQELDQFIEMVGKNEITEVQSAPGEQ